MDRKMTTPDARPFARRLLANWGWLYAGLLVLGLLAVGLLARQAYLEVRLSWFGQTAQGVVIALQQEPRPCDLGRTGLSGAVHCTNDVAVFRYIVAGKTFTSRAYLSGGDSGVFHVGSGVVLHYLADDPQVVTLDQRGVFNTLSLFALVAVAMIASGIKGLQRRASSLQSDADEDADDA